METALVNHHYQPSCVAFEMINENKWDLLIICDLQDMHLTPYASICFLHFYENKISIFIDFIRSYTNICTLYYAELYKFPLQEFQTLVVPSPIRTGWDYMFVLHLTFIDLAIALSYVLGCWNNLGQMLNIVGECVAPKTRVHCSGVNVTLCGESIQKVLSEV